MRHPVKRTLLAVAFGLLVSSAVLLADSVSGESVAVAVVTGESVSSPTVTGEPSGFNPATATGAVGFWDLGNTSTLIKGGYDCVPASSQYLGRLTTLPCVSGGAPQYPITMVCWFKLDATTAANSILVSLDDSASGGDIDSLRMSVTSGNALSASIVDNSSIDDCLTTTSIVDGRWHCGIVVFVSASSRASYSDVDTTGATDTTSVTASGLDRVTMMANAAISVLSDGVIAYTAILPVDLSGAGNATKRANIFKGADPVLEAGLTYGNLTASGAQGAAWKLDNALTDSGPGGYTLTAVNSPTAQNNLIVVRDQTSSAFHLRAFTGTQAPTWSSSSFSNHGGGVFSAASSQHLRRDVAPPVTAAPIQAYSGAMSTSDSTQQSVLWLGDKDSASDHFFEQSFRGDVASDPIRWTTDDASNTSHATTSTGFSASTSCLLWGLEMSATSRAAELNGSGAGTNTTSTTPTAGNLDSLVIGCRGAGSSAPVAGQVGAVLLLNTSSTSQQSQIEDWFETNLGISIP